MSARHLAMGMWFVTAAFAEEAPRAIQVAEPPAEAAPAGQEWVVSRSKQFRVKGGDSLARGSAALLSEESKDELLKLTGEKDDWKVPVLIRMQGKRGDPLPARTVSLKRMVVENVSELHIFVHVGRGFENELEPFKRGVTSALLYERYLKNRPAGNPDDTLFVPPWLSDGLREATAWRLNQSDRHLYAALFKNGGLFKIEDLFMTGDRAFEDMDAATRAAFRVSAGALVMALLEQPQGKEGFRAFLTEVAGFEGEMPGLLRKHFPELNLSSTSLAKWWTLQLANKGGLNLLTDIHTVSQSETALAESLRLSFRTEEGIVVQKEWSAWPELADLKEEDRRAAVHQSQDALIRLSYRCFPSYRPLLLEYQSILDLLVKNKTKGLAERITALEETRATMSARAARARDYLNWFEITRARETSGVFDDYLRLKERLKENPIHREDGLSEYLDRMDRIFYREEKKSLMPSGLPE